MMLNGFMVTTPTADLNKPIEISDERDCDRRDINIPITLRSVLSDIR
jgi:hypothetical protein